MKDKRKVDGCSNRCKSCENLKRRNTPIKPKPREGFKYCTKCNAELSLDNFNVRKILGVMKPFSWCKKCEQEYNNNRYEHNCNYCGKTYRSGRKTSKGCKDCWDDKIGAIGSKALNAIDWSGKNNPMYGIKRFGEENHNYNPNKTDEERESQRHIKGYEEWRDSVYTRDNFTCKCCGDNKGGNLNAHHLNSYSWYKEGRTDVENGITLCDSCHKEFHSIYSYFNNTKQQFEQFLFNKFSRGA